LVFGDVFSVEPERNEISVCFNHARYDFYWFHYKYTVEVKLDLFSLPLLSCYESLHFAL
jgi:hypothetical protein